MGHHAQNSTNDSIHCDSETQFIQMQKTTSRDLRQGIAGQPADNATTCCCAFWYPTFHCPAVSCGITPELVTTSEFSLFVFVQALTLNSPYQTLHGHPTYVESWSQCITLFLNRVLHGVDHDSLAACESWLPSDESWLHTDESCRCTCQLGTTAA